MPALRFSSVPPGQSVGRARSAVPSAGWSPEGDARACVPVCPECGDCLLLCPQELAGSLHRPGQPWPDPVSFAALRQLP